MFMKCNECDFDRDGYCHLLPPSLTANHGWQRPLSNAGCGQGKPREVEQVAAVPAATYARAMDEKEAEIARLRAEVEFLRANQADANRNLMRRG